MKQTTLKTIRTAVLAGVCSAIVFVPLAFAAAKIDKQASVPTQSARANGINSEMIYMPGKGNGVCNDQQGARDSCMADVRVTYADGVKREGFGVFIGHNLIATDYELVTGRGDGHAVKPDDGHTYTVALGDGTTRKAKPWAFVPGAVAVLQMQ